MAVSDRLIANCVSCSSSPSSLRREETSEGAVLLFIQPLAGAIFPLFSGLFFQLQDKKAAKYWKFVTPSNRFGYIAT